VHTIHAEPIFGHLHIVFRDWTYEGDADSVHTTLFTPEHCTSNVALVCPSIADPKHKVPTHQSTHYHHAATAPDAALRNQIREAVGKAFQSITVWLLPPPVDQVSALKKELVASDLSGEFKAQVRACAGRDGHSHPTST